MLCIKEFWQTFREGFGCKENETFLQAVKRTFLEGYYNGLR